jgi:hypothetical protein
MEVLLTVVSKIPQQTKTVPLIAWRQGEKESIFFFEYKDNKDVMVSDTIKRLEITVRP